MYHKKHDLRIEKKEGGTSEETAEFNMNPTELRAGGHILLTKVVEDLTLEKQLGGDGRRYKTPPKIRVKIKK